MSGRQMYTGSVSVAPAAYKRQLPHHERFQYESQFAYAVYFRLRRRTARGKKRNSIDMGIRRKRRHSACKRQEMLFAAILTPHIQPHRDGNAQRQALRHKNRAEKHHQVPHIHPPMPHNRQKSRNAPTVDSRLVVR